MPHTGTVLLLDFTPGCVKLMTGSMDKFSRLWDLRTSQLFHEWEHNGEVGADDVTPDGRFIITGSRDKTAGLWVATTGAKLDNIPLGDGLRSLAFSPNGSLALRGSFDKTARLVDLGKYFDLGRIAAYYRARLAQILNYNITQHIGPRPNPPVIAPCGEEERETQYCHRVTAETGVYNAKLEEHAAKQDTFPAWRVIRSLNTRSIRSLASPS